MYNCIAWSSYLYIKPENQKIAQAGFMKCNYHNGSDDKEHRWSTQMRACCFEKHIPYRPILYIFSITSRLFLLLLAYQVDKKHYVQVSEIPKYVGYA
jgi:hypothetical protein